MNTKKTGICKLRNGDYSFIYFFFIVAFLQLLCNYSFANSENNFLFSGEIIDTVKCKKNPHISYALLLPPDYNGTITWPVIYVFDPGARGKLACSYFSLVSKKLGYIIICSNNSKNGMSYEEETEDLEIIFNDVGKRFSINKQRIYTAGFSGGSRVAFHVAFKFKNISGVIACGAGLPYDVDKKNIPKFNYYELVGNRDMNFLEMYELEKEFDGLGVTVELRTFNGGHEWPSPDLLLEAVKWQEFQAMNKGVLEKDNISINHQFENYKEKAELLLKQGKIIESVYCYENILKFFPEQIALYKIEEKLNSLKESKDYKKSLDKWNSILLKEKDMDNLLVSILIKQSSLGSLPDSIILWWESQIDILKQLESGKDTLKQEMASRILNLTKVLCLENGDKYIDQKFYKAASICYKLGSIIDSDNYYMHYLLARSYALDSKKTSSLKYLKRAVKLGYNNYKSIKEDPAFIELRNEKQFRKIINQDK